MTDQVIRANRVLARTDKVSGSYCSAKNGMLFPEEACWEANLNRCVTLSDNIARTVLHKLGESEAYFLAEESDCNDAGGIVFEAKDCLEVTGSSFVAGGRYCGGVSKQQKADLIARSKVSQPYASTSETLTSTASSSSSEMVWCASRNAVSWVNKYTCWARYGGKAFPTESEALAEYKRLRATSTSTDATSIASSSSSGKVWCGTKNEVDNAD